jgi:hypothetical protein
MKLSNLLKIVFTFFTVGSVATVSAQSLFCEIQTSVICYSGESSCGTTGTPILKWAGKVDKGSGAKVLRVCFNNTGKCYESKAQSLTYPANEISNALFKLNEPGLPSKVFGTFTWSNFDDQPKQMILYFPAIKGKPPITHLMTGVCSAAGKKKA